MCAKKVHGHAPRVRRRKNEGTSRRSGSVVNKDEAKKQVANAAISTATGEILRRVFNG